MAGGGSDPQPVLDEPEPVHRLRWQLQSARACPADEGHRGLVGRWRGVPDGQGPPPSVSAAIAGPPGPARVDRQVDGLHVREPSANPRRNTIVRLLRGEVTADYGADGLAVLAEQLLALITEQCDRRPTVLVIDDLQWADQESVRMWGRLARSAPQMRPRSIVAACWTITPHVG